MSTPHRGRRESLATRIAALRTASAPRVAYVYGRADTSTFRYRVYNMVEALRADPQASLTASWFQMHEVQHVLPLVPGLQALVLGRVSYTAQVANLVARARLAGVRVFFDCDDLVFDIRYTQLVISTLDQDGLTEDVWQTWFALLGRIQGTAQLCDAGITTNAFLAERMARIVEGPVHVVPNFLNRRQQDLSRALFDRKQAQGFQDDGTITIGYFSGTPTHNLDFAIVLPALVALMRRDPQVNLRIVGFMKAFETLSEFGDRIEVIPLQDWMNLQVKIAEVDINIAPLQQNEFTNCKSELKYFEAAVVGTWTCATRSFTMQHAIHSAEIGYLTENSGWLAALDEAVALARDKRRYAERARHAADHALAAYGWDRHVEAIKTALLG